ncbi:uncharacterized protein LY79DRAFT_550075 [Colletotrichum navitas]|uniref:Uncharacterized protein n=1 Tax=Colletotrichum navitas TaxID=681940 RepID=A0AAD8Q1N5_9PEZI|nr:uncharacterized protein LY79DRAFT_550075 [Colletotrichum navitas]KAK1594181.1 hypothetical protein LY79DRAFT_550075 [Colletotrichum navitas]
MTKTATPERPFTGRPCSSVILLGTTTPMMVLATPLGFITEAIPRLGLLPVEANCSKQEPGIKCKPVRWWVV